MSSAATIAHIHTTETVCKGGRFSPTAPIPPTTPSAFTSTLTCELQAILGAPPSASERDAATSFAAYGDGRSTARVSLASVEQRMATALGLLLATAQRRRQGRAAGSTPAGPPLPR